MRSIQTCLSSPPDRELLVVEFFQGSEQWAELNQENGQLTLEIYCQRSGQPWQLDLDEVIEVLQQAKQQLTAR